MWLHLALEERLDVLQKGHVLRVTERWIGLGAALPVAADLRLFVAFRQRGENGLPERRGELELRLLNHPGKLVLEDGPIQEEFVRQAQEQGLDGGLLLATRRLVLDLGGTLLARHRQVDEGALVAESSDPLAARLEIEPERSFDRDLAEAEVRGGVDAADDSLVLLSVPDDLAGCAVLEVVQQPQNVLLALERDLAALGAQALAQQDPEGGGVDELDLTAPLGPFAVGEHPDVGGDAGVVEELLGERDQCFQPVVFEDPAANLALAAAGVAGEERRAVHDDGDPRSAPGRVLGVCQHVQQEQELAVADPRQPRPEAPGSAPVVLGPTASWSRFQSLP